MDFVRATRAPIRRLIEGHPVLALAPFSPCCVYTRGPTGLRHFHVDKGPYDTTTEVFRNEKYCGERRGRDEIFADI